MQKGDLLKFINHSKHMRLKEKLYVLGLVSVLGFGLFSNVAAMSEVNAAEELPKLTVSDVYLKPADIIDDGEEGSVARVGAALPAKFDARQKGWITPVRDQGDNNTCWAFSTMAAIEANLVKNGYADAGVDLSENQFAYFFYNRRADSLGYTKGDYNQAVGFGYNYLSRGGTLMGSGIALATWAGVTTEAKSPYVSTPAASLCYAADYSVKNVYLYNYDISLLEYSKNTIKQAILDHGAVACGIKFNLNYLNTENAAFYYPKDNKSDTGSGHAVTIVGWDDTYSKKNFKNRPSKDGAWIVKNSYGLLENYAATGTYIVDGGYNYVSYEDDTITEFMAFEMVPKNKQYDNNYQHDGTANPAYGYNSADWYANVFTAKGANGYNEELKAIGIFTLNTTTNYEVQVYTGLKNASKPTSGTKVFSKTVKGTLNDAGYQTITLPKTVSLTAGESFAVLVKPTTISGGRATIGVDRSYNANWIAFEAKTGAKQSFVQLGGKWYDFGKQAEANIRIKAYTDKTKKKSTFKLSNTGVSKGATIPLSVKISPKNVYRNVTWKSSNPNIASVTNKGKLTGKTYGTTTISATFVAGAKTKTLKCKVTVGPSAMKKFSVSGGKKLKVKWQKNANADGYEIWYSASKNGTYKKLKGISSGKKTSYTKKLAKGTWYVKMRPYMKQGKTKLYGSYTGAKQVKIK